MLSVWNFSTAMAVISASVVILTAGYILWAIQRVYLGAEYRGPHADALVPSTMRENLIAGVLFVMAILFGIFPNTFVLRYMDKTVEQQVDNLATWTRTVDAETGGDDDGREGSDGGEVTSNKASEKDETADAPEQQLISELGDSQSERKARS